VQAVVAAYPEVSVGPLRGRSPRGLETDGETRLPEIARERLQRARRGHPRRHGSHRPDLERRLRKGSDPRQLSQHRFEGRAEVGLGEGPYLTGEAPRRRIRIIRLGEGTLRGSRRLAKRRPLGYVLGAPPRERSPESGGARDAGRDRARGCLGQQGEGPPRAYPVDDGAGARSIRRPQLAVCSSACVTTSEMPPLRSTSAAQAPTKP
jgi:hypothetical protein